jgi:hypothetical protein
MYDACSIIGHKKTFYQTGNPRSKEKEITDLTIQFILNETKKSKTARRRNAPRIEQHRNDKTKELVTMCIAQWANRNE